MRALLQGKPLESIWHDRTAQYLAKQRGERLRPEAFCQKEVVELSPLPCWRDFPEAIRREIAERLVTEIVAAARADRKRLKTPAPTDRPRHSKRSPIPWFHCGSRAVRREFRRAYGEFLSAFREAALLLGNGELTAPFPDGSFPPPRPFVATA